MKDPNNLQQYKQPKPFQENSGLDPSAILSIISKNWYWFLITTAISLFGARFYIGHTMPVYDTSVTVLINDTEDRPLVDNSDLLQGLGLPGGMKNLENQIMILKSRDLTEKTLRQLPFETEYYFKTLRNKLPIYPDTPVRIVTIGDIPLPKNMEFALKYNGNNSFTIESQFDSFPFKKTASFGERIEISGGQFSIECINEEVFKASKDQTIYFTIHSMSGLVNFFSNRIKVELLSMEGSILKISMLGTNRERDVDFLNKHIANFQAISLDKKNTEAARRIRFIDDQLVGISDSLSITENRLQQFRSSNRVMDLSAQGQSIIAQVTLLENESASLNLEANYYEYLTEYLTNDASGEIPIVPITMGITDPGLTRLVEELAELQGQLSTRGAGEMNPLQRNLEQKSRTTKEALRETLNGLKRRNSLARAENQTQINRANSKASALPVTERQLLGIERKFKLNDELYTFLLETRAEQEMQKASNRADSEVVDPADARYSKRISPDPIKLYFLGLFSGVGLPFLVLFLRFIFNNKLKEEDLPKMTTIPVVGAIPHSNFKSSTIVFDNPSSIITEAYRLLRSRMQFLTQEANAPVILITSSMPGEGKTHTALNLASVYSLLGKRTILLGMDLRKPRIYQDFSLSNDKGISTWLIGKDKLEDVIQETSFDNLSIIPAGPIPPNPSELIALDKTNELFKALKSKYDFIVIDSSPIGLVSDTYHLASMADVCLLVVRPGYSLRSMLERTLTEISASRTKGMSLVINDVRSDSKRYGYGEKYGYTNDKKRSKKS